MTPGAVAQVAGRIDTVVHIIQLAIAPAFLLTAIGAMLGTMSSGVARIVDRARVLEKQLATTPAEKAVAHREPRLLARRARLINMAITSTVLPPPLVCVASGGLLLDAFWQGGLTTLVAWIFGASLAALIVGLVRFLGKVHIATATLRIGLR